MDIFDGQLYVGIDTYINSDGAFGGADNTGVEIWESPTGGAG